MPEVPDDRAVVLDVLHAYYADADSWAEAEAALRATARRLPASVRPTSLAVDRFLRDRAGVRGLADLVVREARWVLPDPGDDAAAGFLGAVADLLRTLDPDDPDPVLPTPDPHATRTLEGALHGAPPWHRPHVSASRWLTDDLVDRTVNAHVAAAWPAVTATLGTRGRYVATFDAGEVVGEGLVDVTLGRAPRPVPVLTRTSTVRVVLDVDPASGRPFVVTAYPLLPLPGPDETAPGG